MAGLYIHIPFCASRCIYCGFYSTTLLDLRQRYVEAVCREMTIRPLPPDAERGIDTIYLGGGTPSQLTIGQLRQLFIYINKVYGSDAQEITIECNPDDVTDQYAEALVQLGINRVSMGAQTFNDDRLRFLHRRHTAAQVPLAVQRLRDAGICNISIDLMYGFPGETLADWQRDIDTALALNAEHLSAYCLMIEEGTPLYELMHKGDGSPVHKGDGSRCAQDSAQENRPHNALDSLDEELERQMYELLIDQMAKSGYDHYEISNFAKPGFRSRHNSSYWHDVPYIGLGAAAHSYATPVRSRTVFGGSAAKSVPIRSWNASDIRQYIAAIECGERPCEEEVLDDDTHYNDRITTALRTSDGLDLTTLSDKHRHYCMQEARRFLSDGLLRLDDQRLILTRKGLFVSDMVMSSLMLV